MPNPLYNMLMGGGMPNTQPISGTMFQNPMQKMTYIMQAMTDPAAFVRKNLPQIPEQAYNDPTGNAVLQYMMNNMGVTQRDIQNAQNQMPKY